MNFLSFFFPLSAVNFHSLSKEETEWTNDVLCDEIKINLDSYLQQTSQACSERVCLHYQKVMDTNLFSKPYLPSIHSD